MNPVQKTTTPNSRYWVGFGNIIIPAKSPREEFIKKCYNTETVSILTNNGELLNEVRIDRNILQDIEFPEEEQGLGSMLVWVNERTINETIVIAVLSKNNQTQLLNDKEFKLQKETDQGLVYISGRGDKGELYINVETDEDTGGNVFINVVNGSETATFNIDVKGNVNISCDETLIEGTKTRISTLDTNGDEDGYIELDEDLNLKPTGNVNLGEASEPIVLGDKNEESLDALLDGSKDIVDDLKTFANTQKTVLISAAGVPGGYVALIPGYEVLLASMNALELLLNKIDAKIDATKSENSFTD